MKTIAARETEATSPGIARGRSRGFALSAPGHGMPAAAVAPSTPRRAGLPAALKAGIEALSGFSMDRVRVHYDSTKPAQLNALAYAQGSDIHLAAGQERHLPHEAWHVVQQAQGRVKPTLQANGVAINDDGALEQEATAIGASVMAGVAHVGGLETGPDPIAAFRTRSDDMTVNRHSLAPAAEITNGDSPRTPVASLSQSASSAQATVQRTVLSKVYELQRGGTKRVFYSTYDTSREFDDQFAAWAYDTELANAANDAELSDERFPTNVSYYRQRSTNVMGTTKQGPHSLSHSSLSHRVSKRMRDADTGKLTQLRDRQILSPEAFATMLEAEKPGTMKPAAVERMILDYRLSYERLDALLKAGQANKEVRRLIRRLLQLNPYTAYGKGKTTAKGHIKNKNEHKDDSFEKAFDQGAKFRSQEGYEKFRKLRQELYSSEDEFAFGDDEGNVNKKDESREEERFSDDESGSSENAHIKKKRKQSTEVENDDSQTLSPVDVMVLLGRAARGTIYMMRDDDWPFYEQYKRDHPDKRYSR